jgi:hypothetical protein
MSTEGWGFAQIGGLFRSSSANSSKSDQETQPAERRQTDDLDDDPEWFRGRRHAAKQQLNVKAPRPLLSYTTSVQGMSPTRGFTRAGIM